MDKKVIIITGSAECLFHDLLQIKIDKLANVEECDVLCVNQSALYYPYFFQHWASLHPELFKCYGKYVQNKCKFVTHSNRITPEVERCWSLYASNGDSGLFAVRVALRLEYEKIILCGMPLDGQAKFYTMKDSKCFFDCTTNQALWKETAADEFEDRVRSMSGNTREFLGAPTKEWINGK